MMPDQTAVLFAAPHFLSCAALGMNLRGLRNAADRSSVQANQE
jgi:hypothetical protein